MPILLNAVLGKKAKLDGSLLETPKSQKEASKPLEYNPYRKRGSRRRESDDADKLIQVAKAILNFYVPQLRTRISWFLGYYFY